MLVRSAVTSGGFPLVESILDRGTSASILTALNVFNVGGASARRPVAQHQLLGLDLGGTCIAVLLRAFATLGPVH